MCNPKQHGDKKRQLCLFYYDKRVICSSPAGIDVYPTDVVRQKNIHPVSSIRNNINNFLTRTSAPDVVLQQWMKTVSCIEQRVLKSFPEQDRSPPKTHGKGECRRGLAVHIRSLRALLTHKSSESSSWRHLYRRIDEALQRLDCPAGKVRRYSKRIRTR
jgi:hypothetical protein